MCVGESYQGVYVVNANVENTRGLVQIINITINYQIEISEGMNTRERSVGGKI